MSALFAFTTKEKGDEQMKKRLFFVCALCALLAVALPALGERVELMDGRVSVELPEGVFCVRGSVTEEQAAMFGASAAEMEADLEKRGVWMDGIILEPLAEIFLYAAPVDSKDDFARTQLSSLVEVAGLFNVQMPGCNARIFLHRQIPFIVYDQEVGNDQLPMETKTYMTELGGYMLQIAGTSIGAEWGTELDAMLADLVDGLILTGRPCLFAGMPAEDGKEIPVRHEGGLEFTLPEGWEAPSASQGGDGASTVYNKGTSTFMVQQVDAYGQMSMLDKFLSSRHDVTMDDPNFLPEDVLEIFDNFTGYADMGEMMDEEMQALLGGLPIQDKMHFEVVEQDAQAGGEIIEIGGLLYYYRARRYQMTLDNDTFVCRDFPMTMEYYCTIENGYLYLYTGNTLYADAPSPEIEQIMRSITYAH